MKPLQYLVVGCLAAVDLGNAAPTARAVGPTCRDVWFTVPVTATNIQIPTNFAFLNPFVYVSEALSNLINIQATGTYSIYGLYCEPAVAVSSASNTLQLLVHGAARDHHYWNSYDFNGTPYGGSNYSWIAQASSNGYPTLAIDRLGDGLSSHPNPNTTVQLPAHAAIINQLVVQINNGALGRSFDDIVYVGHSLGSLIGQLVAINYPNIFKRMILTGWAQVNALMLQTTTTYGPTSGQASVVDPARFGNLPAGYMIDTNATYDALATYYGYATPNANLYFDAGFPGAVFPYRQTSTTGEVATEPLIVQTASGYAGKVLALTGQRDSFWCGPPGSADCGSGSSSPVATAKTLFPIASSYDYYIPANTGHELLFHYSASQTYFKVWSWMKSSAS